MADQPELGVLLNGTARRDAVHVAIAPVIANHSLDPGTRVRLIPFQPDRVEKTLPGDDAIGIIDPFLGAPVLSGQRCWLWLFPRSITSLRHVWTHPLIPAEPAPDVNASRAWIAEFGARYDLNFPEIMKAAERWIQWGTLYVFHGHSGQTVPPEFWDHYEVVTGQPVAASDRENFFTCEC